MHSKSLHKHSKKSTAGESGSAKSMPLPGSGTVNSDPAVVLYMTYAEQLKSPKWQKKRLEIMERDGFKCRICNDKDSELNVHHVVYHKNKMMWDYNDGLLITLCKDCHESLHTVNNDALIAMWMTVEKFGFDSITKLFGFLIEINKKWIDGTTKKK